MLLDVFRRRSGRDVPSVREKGWGRWARKIGEMKKKNYKKTGTPPRGKTLSSDARVKTCEKDQKEESRRKKVRGRKKTQLANPEDTLKSKKGEKSIVTEKIQQK